MWFVSTQPPYGTLMPQSGRRPQHQKRPWCHVGSNVWFPRKETSIDGHQGAITVIAAIRGTTFMEYELRVPSSPQSALILADRIVLPHLSVNSAMNLPKSAGELTNAVLPKSASRAFIFGSASTTLISLLSLSTISVGVFRGAPIPCQPLAS